MLIVILGVAVCSVMCSKFHTLPKVAVVDLSGTHNIKLLKQTHDNLFNISWILKDNAFFGIGRIKKGIFAHKKLKQIQLDMKTLQTSSINTFTVPKCVEDTFVGEVKFFNLHGQLYLYSHFFGKRKSLNIFPETASSQSNKKYFQSQYKNYLVNLKTKHTVPLFYDVYPGSGQTHKNFLLFEDPYTNNVLAITNVLPHTIFKIDLSTGYMTPFSQHKTELDLMDGKFEPCLSGGPIHLPHLKKFLVAGHLRHGGWGGFRMTFFYLFNDTHPYQITHCSPPTSFGFSSKLEYLNQMFLHENQLYMSIGVNDDYSVLIGTQLSNILLNLHKIT